MLSINDIQRDLEAKSLGLILDKLGFIYRGNMFQSKNFSSKKPYHKLNQWIVYVIGKSVRKSLVYQLNLFHLPTNSWFTLDFLTIKKTEVTNDFWQYQAKSLLLDLINLGLDFSPLNKQSLINQLSSSIYSNKSKTEEKLAN